MSISLSRKCWMGVRESPVCAAIGWNALYLSIWSILALITIFGGYLIGHTPLALTMYRGENRIGCDDGIFECLAIGTLLFVINVSIPLGMLIAGWWSDVRWEEQVPKIQVSLILYNPLYLVIYYYQFLGSLSTALFDRSPGLCSYDPNRKEYTTGCAEAMFGIIWTISILSNFSLVLLVFFTAPIRLK